MKLVLFSIIIVLSSFSAVEDEFCDDLKFSIEVTHTSSGLDNGVIDVVIIKSESKAKAYLYGESKNKNKLDVELSELTGLKSGKYILVLQNKKCSTVEHDIIIR